MESRKIKKLCIVSHYYPTPDNPIYMFVDVLVKQIADMGVECHVLVVTNRKYDKNKGKDRIHITKNGNKVYVHCPKTRLFLNRKVAVFPINMYKVNTWMRYLALKRAYYEHIKNADAIYAHFWLESGLPAAMLAKRIRKPLFIATGEDIDSFCMDTVPVMKKKYKLWNRSLSGVITVSTALKKAMEEYRMLPEGFRDKIQVVPNAIESDLFFYRNDKKRLREKYHIPGDKFVVIFVASFSERKGYDIVYRILERNFSWMGIMIGGEEPEAHPEHILFPGKVSHEILPEYMNLADVFVLPTISEGCCNTIIEAMACGLPAVTSNREFNYDIIDKESGILVNPLSESEVEEAIRKLETDEIFRESISQKARERVKDLIIGKRAEKIYHFMESII